MATESSSAKRWLPLEANPEVMNQVFVSLSLLLLLRSSAFFSKLGRLILGQFSDFFLYWCVLCTVSLGAGSCTRCSGVQWCVWIRRRTSWDGSEACSCCSLPLPHHQKGLFFRDNQLKPVFDSENLSLCWLKVWWFWYLEWRREDRARQGNHGEGEFLYEEGTHCLL